MLKNILILNKRLYNLKSLIFPNQKYFSKKINIDEIPTLNDFMKSQSKINQMFNENLDKMHSNESYLKHSNLEKAEQSGIKNKKFYIETYGCQMNESDTEIVNSILEKSGYLPTKNFSDAQIILLNTCAVRENAESKVWNRLKEIRALKNNMKTDKLIVGVLGCMAERLKDNLVEKNKAVDIIVGPDSYRDLPQLIAAIQPDSSNYGINVQLSMDETYADITPVRQNPENNSAFVSIMRGCNNMCSFCIVPFTRGRERSRSLESIVDEVKLLRDSGVKEVTLLGQNVNSYWDQSHEGIGTPHTNAEGFKEMYKLRSGSGARFADLLQKVADEAPNMRIRFTSPHPKDFPDPVIEVIKHNRNICKNLHIPAQSGNSRMLDRMRRNYTREAYIGLIDKIRSMIPEISFSTDLICGFCGETEEEFEDTITLMNYVKYEQAFLFAYSMREKTHAHRNYQDDVPEEVKQKRLERMINAFHKNQIIRTQADIGRYHIVLVEGTAKHPKQLKGRTDTNKVCIFDADTKILPNLELYLENSKNLQNDESNTKLENINKGDYIIAKINKTTTRTLFGTPIAKTTINEFFNFSKEKPYFILQKITI